jgi:hypothetical protein
MSRRSDASDEEDNMYLELRSGQALLVTFDAMYQCLVQ